MSVTGRKVLNSKVLGLIKYVVSQEPGAIWTYDRITEECRKFCPNLYDSNVPSSLDYVWRRRMDEPPVDRFPGAQFESGQLIYEGPKLRIPNVYRNGVISRNLLSDINGKLQASGFEKIGDAKSGAVLLRDGEGVLWKAERFEF